jgi:hypothetical protein
MGLFSKKSQPEPVDPARVMHLINLGMRETDAGDRDLLDDQPSAEFKRAKAEFEREMDRATPAERTAAYGALRRHGY